MTLRLHRYGSAREFLDASAPHLLRYESQYNLKIGLSEQIATGKLDGAIARFYAVQNARGEAVGQVVQTSPVRPLLLSHMNRSTTDFLVDALVDEEPRPVVVVGPLDTVKALAARWVEVTGQRARLDHELLVYEARSIAAPPAAGGQLVPVGERDRDLAREWMVAFVRECFPDGPEPLEMLDEPLSRMLRQGLLFFWKGADGEPLSMAARSRESPNGATVSYVYTPGPLRRQGHASRLVGHLSQRILDGGKAFCCLLTDAANPSTNRIYRRLGYELVGANARVSFRSP